MQPHSSVMFSVLRISALFVSEFNTNSKRFAQIAMGEVPVQPSVPTSKTGARVRRPEPIESTQSKFLADTDDLIPPIVELVGLGRKQNGFWLEFACGDGTTLSKHFVHRLEATNSTLYALDISPEIVAVAQNKNPHPRVQYLCGDILSTENDPLALAGLGETKFDGIFTFWVMNLVEPRPIVRRLHKLLKPSARIAIAVPEHTRLCQLVMELKTDPFWAPYATELKFPLQKHNQDQHESNSSQAEGNPSLGHIVPILEELGFRIVKADVHPRSFVYDRAEEFVNHLLAIHPNAEGLPDGLWVRLKDWYAHMLLGVPQPKWVTAKRVASDGDILTMPFVFEYNAVFIVAEKSSGTTQ